MNQLEETIRTGKVIGKIKYMCKCGKKMTIDVFPGMTEVQKEYLGELFDKKKCPRCHVEGIRGR